MRLLMIGGPGSLGVGSPLGGCAQDETVCAEIRAGSDEAFEWVSSTGRLSLGLTGGVEEGGRLHLAAERRHVQRAANASFSGE